jgi:hypothetical protein
MTKKKYKRKTKRGFLNKKEGVAIFQWDVEEYGGSFTITDCGRASTLDFSLTNPYNNTFSSEDARKKSLVLLEKDWKEVQHKLQVLGDALKDFGYELNEVYSCNKTRILESKIVKKKKPKVVES